MGMPMHAPSLAETTAFVAVVELKSFTKAAKQLALSPPFGVALNVSVDSPAPLPLLDGGATGRGKLSA